jgi:hypothetical protein
MAYIPFPEKAIRATMMSIPTSDPIHAPIMISVQNMTYSRLSIVLHGFMAKLGMNGNTVKTVFRRTLERMQAGRREGPAASANIITSRGSTGSSWR